MDANTREKKNRAHTNQQNEVKKKYDRNNKIFQPTEPFFPRLVTVFLISSLFFFLHSNAKAPIVSAPVFGFDRFSVVGSINQCMSTK